MSIFHVLPNKFTLINIVFVFWTILFSILFLTTDILNYIVDGTLSRQLLGESIDSMLLFPIYSNIPLLIQLVFEHKELKKEDNLTDHFLYARYLNIFANNVVSIPILILVNSRSPPGNIDNLYILLLELQHVLYICVTLNIMKVFSTKETAIFENAACLIAIIYIHSFRNVALHYTVLTCFGAFLLCYCYHRLSVTNKYCMIPLSWVLYMGFIACCHEALRLIVFKDNFLFTNCSKELLYFKHLFMPCLFTFIGSILGNRTFKKLQTMESALHAQEALVRNMSHEMRSPLCVMSMVLENLSKEMERFVPAKEYESFNESIKDALSPGSLILEYLNDLLLFSKMKKNLMDTNKSNIKMFHFLNECISFHTQVLKNKRIEFSLTCNPHTSNAIVDIDQSKISIVMNNYMSNAIKFTPSRGEISVNVSTCHRKPQSILISLFSNKVSPGHNTVRVEVADSGIGLAAQDIQQLFQEGVQIDAAANQAGGGSGFGLAFSKGLVEAHGGCVGVFSKGQGQGSTFFFEIPIVSFSQHVATDLSGTTGDNHISSMAKDIEMGPVLQADRQSINHSPEWDIIRCGVALKADVVRPKVLIVEDVKLVSKYMAKHLSSMGYEYVIVENGLDAVELLKTAEDFDIILMDNRLPGLDGPDAIREIRLNGFTKSIIGVSGDGDEETKLKYFQAGADELTIKPVDSKTLKACFESAERSCRLRSFTC